MFLPSSAVFLWCQLLQELSLLRLRLAPSSSLPLLRLRLGSAFIKSFPLLRLRLASSSRAFLFCAFNRRPFSSSSPPLTGALSPVLLLFFFARSFLESPCLHVLFHLSVSSAPSVFQVSPAANRKRRCICSLIKHFLSTLLVSCVHWLGSWLPFFVCYLFFLSFCDQLTFHVRLAILQFSASNSGVERGGQFIS